MEADFRCAGRLADAPHAAGRRPSSADDAWWRGAADTTRLRYALDWEVFVAGKSLYRPWSLWTTAETMSSENDRAAHRSPNTLLIRRPSRS